MLEFIDQVAEFKKMITANAAALEPSALPAMTFSSAVSSPIRSTEELSQVCMNIVNTFVKVDSLKELNITTEFRNSVLHHVPRSLGGLLSSTSADQQLVVTNFALFDRLE